MKNLNRKTGAKIIPLAVLLMAIIAIRFTPAAAEGYARKVYPVISAFLSAVSAPFPFSLGDLFVVVSIVALLAYVGYAIYKRRPFGHTLFHVALFAGYVYIWFYLAWGLNYFRHDFYTRTGIPYAPYKMEAFRSFLDNYIDSLNNSYLNVKEIDTSLVQLEITEQYNRIAPQFGMLMPRQVRKPKPMWSSALMSKTGVLGYMEPFFSEFCLNKELLPVQYPQTYAHELSHRLSISNEAEANLYAYLACTASTVPEIKFSGYFSLFPYVMQNAAMALPEVEYKGLVKRIRPEIIGLYRQKQAYWESRYSSLIGNMQQKLYNFFLKGNNIPTGTANYSEVIGLLISYENAKNFQQDKREKR